MILSRRMFKRTGSRDDGPCVGVLSREASRERRERKSITIVLV
jgi:hypothetical protein